MAGEGATADGRLRVVATTSIVRDLVENIGGDAVRVTSLMGPGVDPHLYKASARDVVELADADLVLYNGLHLESKMADVLEEMDHFSPSVAVAEAVDPARLISPPAYAGAYDPHVWFDVTLWRQAAERVRAALVEHDRRNAPVYEANARRHLARLDSLDVWVRARTATVPADRRVIVTAHDAFNYFGQAYGYEVRGLQGISTATEAGTGDVQALARFLVERRIPAVFVESSVSPRTIRAVQAAVRAMGSDVRIGAELYSDALGEPGSEAATYEGMVRHNVDAIVTALRADPFHAAAVR